MARAILFAFFILSFNIALMTLDLIDQEYMEVMNVSLFGFIQPPYVDYDYITDSEGHNISFSSYQNISAGTERALDYGAQTGVSDDLGFWGYTKQAGTTIVNFLYRGFFGLPGFLRDHFGLPNLFVYPLYIIFGIIQILGVIEFIRGKAL